MYGIEEIKKSKTNDEFKFVCKHCGKEFVRTKRQISKNNGNYIIIRPKYDYKARKN